jgi:asparagine synthase (glutamine-hydrolysing)
LRFYSRAGGGGRALDHWARRTNAMCGIGVAIDWDDAEAVVRRLVAGVSHRGDIDDPIVAPAKRIAMGTRRLRIVDSDNAVQPQPSFDNRFLVSFNGEIYNHAELRRELEGRGVAFRTASDTEVLASSLRVWGPKVLERINGMYAFVALDLATGEFLAARDPLGVKPLYLINSGSRYLFCSEMRPLLSAAEKGDVLLLPPGHLLTRTHLLQFASLAGPAGQQPERDAKTLDALLTAAVHARLPPSLPCALLYSGGIDSTLVAHYARQIRPDAPGYFLGDDRAPDYRYAALYAEATGLDLRRVPLDPGEAGVDAQINDVVEAAETFEPSVVRDGLCAYLLSRRVHEDGYRVALAGEGADEIFAGYVPLELAYADGDATGAFVRDQCLLDMHRTNLQRLDRCGMRFQLEIREPFLDPGVVRHALALGAEDLILWANDAPRGKAPLRGLWELHEELPAAIRDRRKTPLHVGSGFDKSQKSSPWIDHAEETISDREFADGRRRFEPFDLRTKEELMYLSRLAATLDVRRIPHLTARPRLRFPQTTNLATDKTRLSDFLVEA